MILVAVIWGGGFAAGKFALVDLEPVAVLMYRFTLSALAVGILFFKKILHSTKKEIFWGSLLGFLMYSGLLIQLLGLQHTTASKQAFILASYVMFTPLLSWLLFKDRPTKNDFITSAMILIGVGFISLNEVSAIQSGDFISLGFSVIFALQIIIISRFTKELSAVNLTFFQLLSAAIYSVIVILINGTPITLKSSYGISGVLYLSLINTAIAMVLQNVGQKFTTETHAALLLSLESVFGFLVCVAVFHDPVSVKILLGCILVFSGVLLSKLRV